MLQMPSNRQATATIWPKATHVLHQAIEDTFHTMYTSTFPSTRVAVEAVAQTRVCVLAQRLLQTASAPCSREWGTLLSLTKLLRIRLDLSETIDASSANVVCLDFEESSVLRQGPPRMELRRFLDRTGSWRQLGRLASPCRHLCRSYQARAQHPRHVRDLGSNWQEIGRAHV